MPTSKLSKSTLLGGRTGLFGLAGLICLVASDYLIGPSEVSNFFLPLFFLFFVGGATVVVVISRKKNLLLLKKFPEQYSQDRRSRKLLWTSPLLILVSAGIGLATFGHASRWIVVVANITAALLVLIAIGLFEYRNIVRWRTFRFLRERRKKGDGDTTSLE